MKGIFGHMQKFLYGTFVPQKTLTPGAENYLFIPLADVIDDPLGGPGYPMTAYCGSYPTFGPNPADWNGPVDNSPVIDGLEGVAAGMFEGDPVIDMDAYLQALAQQAGGDSEAQ